MTRAPLAGRGVLITRPRELAHALAALIAASGGVPILFPVIEIRDVDPAPLAATLDALETFDIAVFVSPSAVSKAMELARRQRAGRPWPPRMQVAAIGGGSRRELERHGLHAIIAPHAQADSEALLAMPEMQALGGKRVLIFRGDGGRNLLGDTLASRGARVAYAECYRRVRPDADSAELLAAWSRAQVHALTVSSGTGLANLAAILADPGRLLLQETPLFVSHERVAAAAAALGVRAIHVAGPSDDDMHAALVAYFGAAQ